MKKESIAILGLGKLGTAAGHLLGKAGYEIAAVATRSGQSLERGLPYTGGTACKTFAEAAALARCIFITTTDDMIAPVCREIADRGALGEGKKVVHMSGAAGLDILAPARQRGASIASIHPIQSFADIDGAIRNMPGSTFGITCGEDLREWCLGIVHDLGGTPVLVPDGSRALYHAAACIASNYLVCLMGISQRVYEKIGLDPGQAVSAFWPLVKGTIRNIEEKGTVQSLTGPIARGDVRTIEKHLKAFREEIPELLEFYKLMAAFAVEAGTSKGSLTPERAGQIRKLLQEVENEH